MSSIFTMEKEMKTRELGKVNEDFLRTVRIIIVGMLEVLSYDVR